MRTINVSGMKYVIRNYKGYLIESFDCSQLGGEEEYKGRAYSIYRNEQEWRDGCRGFNMNERIDYLADAKDYIDQLIESQPTANQH